MNDQLACSEVVVFQVDLNQTATTLDRLRKLLSSAERDRADRLRFERGAERFIAVRAALRIVLGNALKIAPEAVRLRARPNGKPELDEQISNIRFNLSHSADLALIAVAFGREVGVQRRASQIARRCRRACRTLLRRSRTRRTEMLAARSTNARILSMLDAKRGVFEGDGRGLVLSSRSFRRFADSRRAGAFDRSDRSPRRNRTLVAPCARSRL